MTGINLDAIQARADAATEGPWGVKYDQSDEYGNTDPAYPYAILGPANVGMLTTAHLSDDFKAQYGHEMTEIVGISDEDAEFIAHARTDVPALIAAVRERDATIARVRNAMWSAHAHRFDLEETPTVGPGKPAGGPDVFYNGIRYVVTRIRAALDPQEGQ